MSILKDIIAEMDRLGGVNGQAFWQAVESHVAGIEQRVLEAETRLDQIEAKVNDALTAKAYPPAPAAPAPSSAPPPILSPAPKPAEPTPAEPETVPPASTITPPA